MTYLVVQGSFVCHLRPKGGSFAHIDCIRFFDGDESKAFWTRALRPRTLSTMLESTLPQAVEAFGISGSFGKMLASHPPIEERIAALRAGQG